MQYIAFRNAFMVMVIVISSCRMNALAESLALKNEIKLTPIDPGTEIDFSGEPISGHFIGRDQGGMFVTTDKKEFKLDVPFDISKLKSRYAGEVELKVSPEGKAKVSSIVNSGLKKAQEDLQKLPAGNLRNKISSSLNQLQIRLDESVTGGTDSTTKAAKDFGQGARDVLALYIQASEQEQKTTLKTVSLLYLNLLKKQKRGRDKANFGFKDNYPPDSYPKVKNCCGSVGAVRHSEQVIGTAFHLGNGIVLTAAHCLRKDKYGPDVSLGQIDFYFTPTPSAQPEGREIPFGRIILKGDYNKGDDFVIIQAGKNERTPVQLNIPALAYSDTDVGQNTSVFVIGYKEGGDMTVVDGAHVMFPHQFNQQEFYDLKLRLEGELQMELWQANMEPVKEDTPAAEERQRDLEKLIEAHKELRVRFDSSLILDHSDAQRPIWTLVSEFVDKPAIPAFGMDSNTFGGHSGGPVLNRQSCKVVGLFCRGMPDDPAPMRAGVERHEEAIPISYILEQWKRKYPNENEAFAPEKFGFNNIKID